MRRPVFCFLGALLFFALAFVSAIAGLARGDGAFYVVAVASIVICYRLCIMGERAERDDQTD